METLHIQLLGNLSLTYGATPVTIKSSRAQSLLAYLLIHRAAPQSRQQLAFTFWANATERQARNNLRQLIFDLRRALPDADRFIETRDTTLQWRTRAPFTLDVAEFERELATLETQKRETRRAGLERAVGIYQDDLLVTCYDDWIIPERERLRQRFVRALGELVALLQAQHEDCLALEQAQRLLRYDPLREETYCELMQLASRCGDRTGILRYYRACVNTLQRELGVEPSPATRQVYERALTHSAAPQTVKPSAVGAPRLAKTNLPLTTNRFIGRNRELEQIKRLLATQRLVTLIGPSGVGKTRLALVVATEVSSARRVCFIDLGLATNLEQVVSAIAVALEVREGAGARLADTLREYLCDKNLLLVLDNCEHLVTPLRDWLAALLRAAPNVRILATSREGFHISTEVLYRVSPLAVPEPLTTRARGTWRGDHLSEIAQYESVQLFCDRANAILPTFELSAETAPFVAGICRRLDGLPLALELAAARMNVLSAEQIYQRLDVALNLLTRGKSVALPHQHTLQAALDWSYDLLGTAERVLLRRLAVFAGSFDLDAIEQVCDLTAGCVLDVLSDLVDKSIVESQPTANTMRYRLLEVVRQFARAKMRETGEEHRIRQRHCDYLTRWTERGEPELRGARQTDWFAQFEREHDNLRAALEFCQQAGDAENGLRLASALWWFWRARGYLSEGRAHIAQMLTLPNASVSPSVHARVEHGGIPRPVSGRFCDGAPARASRARHRPKVGGQARAGDGALHLGR